MKIPSYKNYKTHYLQKFIIVLCIIVFISGAIFDNPDYLSLTNIFNSDNDKKSLMLTIVQVHATLDTLGIAMLSILTGRFNHKVDGVEVANFIVNKLNDILTQKNIICAMISSVIISFIMIYYGRLGMVFSCFISSAILLIYEINVLWLVFNDDAEISKLIKDYIITKCCSEEDFIIKYLQATVDGDLSNWSSIDLERYKYNVIEVWKIIITKLKTQEQFDKYCSYYVKSIKGLLEKGNTAQKCLAVSYLVDLYSEYNKAGSQFSINIYADVSYSLYNVLPDLDTKALENAIVYLPKVVIGSAYNMENTKNE